MTATKTVPAAQYLRMSTEHQQYSIDGQSTAIEAYANLHGSRSFSPTLTVQKAA
jgi:DNA invertase Pin-like site-specific DNA recombinase